MTVYAQTVSRSSERGGHHNSSDLARCAESSRYGEGVRDERRFPSGWWLLPAFVAGCAIWFLILRAVWVWFT